MKRHERPELRASLLRPKFSPFVFLNTLLGGCLTILVSGCVISPGFIGTTFRNPTLAKAAVENLPGQNAFVVITEEPVVVVQAEEPGKEETTFYDWLFTAVRAYGGRNNYVFADNYVHQRCDEAGVEHFIAEGRNPLSKGTPWIHQLAVAEDKIPKLCELTASFGATHVIKAKLVSRTVQWETLTKERDPKYGWQPSRTTFSGDILRMVVWAEVYDARTGRVVFFGTYDSHDYVVDRPFLANVTSQELTTKHEFMTWVTRPLTKRDSRQVK
ncbi:MAG: hypothetical protein HY301_13480 [Verrucomicrobia bacterium]|nr:hypothetical protein [Verrucomicrobiota bacterium]